MFLEQQISILEWFLKDHVTEDWSNFDENLALHHRNNLHFQMYLNKKKSYFKYNILLYFLIK